MYCFVDFISTIFEWYIDVGTISTVDNDVQGSSIIQQQCDS